MGKIIKSLVILFFVAALLTGCTMAVSPIQGVITDYKAPLAATSNIGYSKVGTATATSILGFGSGDVSIKAAMQNGGITKIHHVDYHSTNVLWVYSKFTVIVYGE